MRKKAKSETEQSVCMRMHFAVRRCVCWVQHYSGVDDEQHTSLELERAVWYRIK